MTLFDWIARIAAIYLIAAIVVPVVLFGPSLLRLKRADQRYRDRKACGSWRVVPKGGNINHHGSVTK